MSLDDLKRLGVLEEEAEAGERSPAKERVRLPWFLLTGGAAVAGAVLMPLGDGGGMTWAGVAIFFAGLSGFIATNIGGIRKDREQS